MKRDVFQIIEGGFDLRNESIHFRFCIVCRVKIVDFNVDGIQAGSGRRRQNGASKPFEPNDQIAISRCDGSLLVGIVGRTTEPKVFRLLYQLRKNLPSFVFADHSISSCSVD